jgi:predicted transcriptional regulator
MEKLNQLLFELSSPDRINILLQLQKKPLKLSHLSRKLDLTVTETTRHLKRLGDALLTEKTVDGLFKVSQYGDVALSLLSPLDFLTTHQNFFLEYDVSPLPHEFVSRMGELQEGEFGGDILGNLDYLEQELHKAKKFIWIQTDQILKNLIPIVAEKLKKPFQFRFISAEKRIPPDNKAPLPSTMPGVQKRALPEVNVIIIVTDQAAGFCLPHKNGRIDYRNIHGTNPKFQKWCKDLFLHYWKQAKPVTPT